MLDLQLFGNEAVQGKRLFICTEFYQKHQHRVVQHWHSQQRMAVLSRKMLILLRQRMVLSEHLVLQVEITATSILKKGDELINKLEKALDDDALIEIWEANLAEPAEAGNNKFKGTYFQGYLTEIEYTANADEFVEVSLTFGINGTGADGDVTVTTQQQEQAYAFVDTPKTGA